MVINMGKYYIDDIAYCSECNSPLEIKRMFLGALRKLPVICECRKKEVDEFEAQRKKRQHDEFINSIKNIGIPDEEYRKRRFSADDMRMPKITNICKKYVMTWDYVYSQNHGMILHGDTGTGKTFYAACIANALAERGINVLMTNIPALISKMSHDFESEKEDVLYRLSKVPLLIIDDFGVERVSDYTTEKIYEIIDTRYRSGKPLIITTNQDTEKWFSDTNVKNERIYSRIREMCSINPPRITGNERRYENFMKKRNDIKAKMQG